MGERRRREAPSSRQLRTGREGDPVIPLEPIDLLAGVAPGLDLTAGDPLADGEDADASVSAAEVGRMLRSGDATLRKLIRTAGIAPSGRRPTAPEVERMRAGVPPRSRNKPGE